MNELTPEKIARLPKWAQEYTLAQARQLATLHAKLAAFEKDQPPSPFFVDEFTRAPQIKRFIAASNRTICAEWAGVHVEIFLPRQNDGQRMFGPEIQYRAITGSPLVHNPVAIIPRGIQTIHLVHKDNL